MPQIRRSEEPYASREVSSNKHVTDTTEQATKKALDSAPAAVSAVSRKPKRNNITGSIAHDDLMLAMVILILLMEDCDDKLLLLVLCFVFLSGI